MPEPYVGVVTVTFNSLGVIEAFMASLEKQRHRNFKLYVVDNDSGDATLQHLSGWDVALNVLAMKTNTGVAEGNNLGIRAAIADGCEYILLLNNDTEFGPELIGTLLRELHAHNADIVTPKIMFDYDRGVIWYAGGYFSSRRGYSGEHYGLGQRDQGQFDAPRKILYAPSCCVLIRRKVFATVGLMDPDYFLYFDDTDFCYRAMLRNVSLWYTPHGVLYHKVGALSGGEKSAFYLRHNTRNHVYFLLKNLGAKGAAFLPAYQALLVYKWLKGKYDTRSFRLVEGAFWEGVRMAWTRRGSEYGA
jgi:GT2 family glycosyltransferase